MAKHTTTTVTLPAELLQTIERLVADGKARDLEDVLVAGVEALTADEAERRWLEYARERFAEGWEAARLEAISAGYLERRASDPRDMAAIEVLACMHSDNPACHLALRAHLDALRDDVRAGAGATGSLSDLLADIDARLGI